MSTDDTGEREESAEGAGEATDGVPEVRERIEREADRAVEGFDDGVVDLLSWVLDTETRARIYVHLRTNPNSTSSEVAEGTGLYPSTVREALAELHEEETVTRRKRENDGAGNNPYEYSAIAPSDLVSDVVEDVQSQLNTVFNLDRYIDADRSSKSERDRNRGDSDRSSGEPVTITVEDEDGDERRADERDG